MHNPPESVTSPQPFTPADIHTPVRISAAARQFAKYIRSALVAYANSCTSADVGDVGDVDFTSAVEDALLKLETAIAADTTPTDVVPL